MTNKLEQAARQALELMDAGSYIPAMRVLREALAEQAEQEFVAEVHNTDTPSNWSIIKPGLPAGTKIYAAPVRTKDMTDDEMEELCRKYARFELIREAIAADREKNK